MASDTFKQIETINKSLRWVKRYRPEHYEQRFLELVGLRRRVRKIQEAEHEKPAIAAFGESQKGKSYLIGNLLQKKKSPFMVKDEEGNLVNFVDRVNPIGDRKEATGVVTRFTPFNGEHEQRYKKEHPVIVKLFSVGNIATILCDSYYNDLLDKQFYADDEINAIADRLYNLYKDKQEIPQSILTEDDILDIKAYLSKYVKDAQGMLRSGYFEKLALVVRRIPYNEWGQALHYLWHENKSITALFQRLLDALHRLNFAREVYVDFDAVMHLGDNKNTIMSVDCLNGLDDHTWSLTTHVFIPDGEQMTTVENFPKCELCALCAETIFKIEPDYLNGDDQFFYEEANAGVAGYMSSSVHTKLPQKVTKDLLKDSDLLDFPGARNRLKVMEEFLMKMDSEVGASNLVQMLLRGKVAYLFNNYSESRIINILLFCHDSDQPSVNDMYRMINDWVEKYVGADSSRRHQTIQQCGGVPPLFVVCTKFNMDMIEKNKEDGDSEAALNQRWSGRFMKVLYTQSFKAESMDWFRNWDAQGATFKNTYLLRDYKYSGCDGSGNNLYEGYSESDENPRERTLHLTPDFYNRLRDTFIKNPDVEQFFADPAMAWDVAATMNNDGALHIIERLGVVSHNMGKTRNDQFHEEMAEIRDRVYNIMGEYYVNTDAAKLLDENIRKGHAVFRELEFTCQTHPEYFGHLLQALQLTEAASFKEIHQLIPTLTDTINAADKIPDYQLIRERCNNFEGCSTTSDYADYWQRIVDKYHFVKKEEAEEFLQRKGIDSQKLFKGEFIARKNSAVIANHMIEVWESRLDSVKFRNNFSGEGRLDDIVLSNLTTLLVNTAKNLQLEAKLETDIAEYTDLLNPSFINEFLIADMIATTISDFVIDFGYRYLTDEQIASARRVAKDKDVLCFDWTDRERQEEYSDQEMTDLFDDILSSVKRFTPAYTANYNLWIEYMYIAYIAHVNVPSDFNPEANNEVADILSTIKL